MLGSGRCVGAIRRAIVIGKSRIPPAKAMEMRVNNDRGLLFRRDNLSGRKHGGKWDRPRRALYQLSTIQSFHLCFSSALQLRIEQKPNALIADFADTKILDESRISQLGEEFDALMGKLPACNRLVLDFTGVVFMSSAMIGKLIALNKACKQAKVDLRIRNVCAPIMGVFKVTRLNMLFKIGIGDFGEEESSENGRAPIHGEKSVA